jgi:N-acetylglutamate synthase
VQLAPAEAWTPLDGRLAERGWSREGDTDVLVAAADDVLARTRPAAVDVAPRLDERWLAAWAACEGRPDAEEHGREVLSRIEPQTGFALADDDAGVGLAVCERGWVGLFSVATAPSARRRGIASGVVHALTRWAAERGAKGVYLLVESDNAPAHALYERAGFKRSHGYHYRCAPATG